MNAGGGAWRNATCVATPSADFLWLKSSLQIFRVCLLVLRGYFSEHDDGLQKFNVGDVLFTGK